jgi:predicted hotdog family 3-hydroxylacyl-ACP dehydratase
MNNEPNDSAAVLPDGLTIQDLLPHRDGMLLVDEVLSVGDEQAITCSTVAPRWPLTNEDGALNLVLLELAAQTAGIYNGLLAHYEDGAVGGRKGWIVGIKSAQFQISQIPLGTRVTVVSRNCFEYDGFREIAAEAAIEGRPIAQITMQLVKADADALMKGNHPA